MQEAPDHHDREAVPEQQQLDEQLQRPTVLDLAEAVIDKHHRQGDFDIVAPHVDSFDRALVEFVVTHNLADVTAYHRDSGLVTATSYVSPAGRHSVFVQRADGSHAGFSVDPPGDGPGPSPAA